MAFGPNAVTRKRSNQTVWEFKRSYYRRVYSDGHTTTHAFPPVGTKSKGTQITTSEGHPFRSRSKGDVSDIGGDFYTSRSHVYVPNYRDAQFEGVKGTSIGLDPTYWTYSGPLLAISPANANPPDSIESSEAALKAKGTIAINRCKPTNSASDLGVALGEIKKDGIPHLIGSRTWKTRTLSGKNAGNEYLNAQFGWKPLVSEVKSFTNAVSRAHKLIKQYERDSGRVVRRRYEFPTETSRSEQVFLNRQPWMAGYTDGLFGSNWFSGKLVITTETTRRTWFSGAFTYWLPSGYDSRKQLDRLELFANKILGTELSPSLLWELAPWSWAADWFGNIGDVLSNVSDAANSGLVLRYGYVMEHTITKVTYRWIGGPPLIGVSDLPLPVVSLTETKQRRGATPFGFGLNWSGLSPYQLSIAAALGLSKGRR